VARNYEEAKERPLYVVTEARNVSLSEKSLPRAILLPDFAPLFGSLVIEDLEPAVPLAVAVPPYRPLAGVRV
jgi:hypothetical protein